MTKKAGHEMKLHYSTTALAAATNAAVDSHSWNEGDDVQDVSRGSERNELSFQTRENGGETQYKGGPLDENLEFTIAYDTGDAFYTALRDAHINNTEIALADTDLGPNVANSKGYAANFVVLQFNQNEPINDIVTISVTCRPSSFIVRDYASAA